jgi:hypothetical protein
VLQTLDGIHFAGLVPGAVQALGQGLEQGVDDEGRFARTGDAGDAGHDPQGDADLDVLQVVFLRADDAQGTVAAAALGRQGDAQLAGQVAPGQGVGIGQDLLRRALADHLAAVHPGAGAHVDDVVGFENGLFVVLHHQHRVAEIAQPFEGVEEAAVVALMQADGRFVEDVQYPDQGGADLGRQADALPLAAGQGARSPLQAQVIEADVGQKGQPLAHFLEDAAGNLEFLVRQAQARRRSAPPHGWTGRRPPGCCGRRPARTGIRGATGRRGRSGRA